MHELAISEAVKLCKKFEGFRSAPYLCPAGKATIGYGSTYRNDSTSVTLKDAPISEPEADAMLRTQIMKVYLPGVLTLCPKLTDYRLAAITDFAYNLGLGRLKGSTLRRVLNDEGYNSAPLEIRKWVMANGVVLKGLVARREAEVVLFQTPPPPSIPVQYTLF